MSDSLKSPPAWVKDAVFYQIFPDRFRRSGKVDTGARIEKWDASPSVHGYKGGDLWGVIEKLDYLGDLGINAIWFNPIFQSPSNHRYHTHDYWSVDPMLGGNKAFDALIEAAHDRNIRVILDGVFNHASRRFFQFSDIAEQQEKSGYVDWFTVNQFPIKPYDEDIPATYNAWWGLHALPQFNTENEAVREFLWSVGTHWIERGADGWRLDVPNELRAEGFWDEFRSRVRSVNPEAYITGEIWHEATDWVGPNGPFDGVMNYPLTNAVIPFGIGNRINHDAIVENNDYHVTPGINAGEFADRIDRLFEIYGPEQRTAMLNLLDSHDTGRLTSLANGDEELIILSLALLMTMPGAPCIYYGTEVGLEGGPDPDSRRGFPWDAMENTPTLTKGVKELIALRHAQPGLRSSDFERIGPLPGPDYGRSYIYARGTGEDRVVIAINHADEDDEVPIAADVLSPSAKCLFFVNEVSCAKGALEMAPRSFGVWADPKSS